jgi:hypothetical protein
MKPAAKSGIAFFIAVLFTLTLFLNALAENQDCYVHIEKSGNFDPNIVSSSAISIISQYVEKVKIPPPGGFKMKDCSYNVSLSESMDGFFLSVSGRKINSIGNSNLPGINGFTQSLLRSIYRILESEDKKQDICRKYNDLMKGDCQPVEAIVMLFDDKGSPIANESDVREGDRFNFMIRPAAELFAYIISKDSNNNMFKIFPNEDVANFGNPLKAGNDYYLPPQKSNLIFEFDHNPGDEKLYFLFSSIPMNDPNAFFRKVEALEIKKKSNSGKITTRGIGLAKSKGKVKINLQTKKIQKDNALAELLKGTGMIIQTISLKHLP